MKKLFLKIATLSLILPLAGFQTTSEQFSDLSQQNAFSGLRQQHLEEQQAWQAKFEACRRSAAQEVAAEYSPTEYPQVWNALRGNSKVGRNDQFRFRIENGELVRTGIRYVRNPYTIETPAERKALLKFVSLNSDCVRQAAEDAANKPDNPLIKKFSDVHDIGWAGHKNSIEQFANGGMELGVFWLRYSTDRERWRDNYRTAGEDWKKNDEPYRGKPVTRATPPSNPMGQSSIKQVRTNFNMTDPEVLDVVKVMQEANRCEISWATKWAMKYPRSEYPKLHRIVYGLYKGEPGALRDDRRVEGQEEKIGLSEYFRHHAICSPSFLEAKPSSAAPLARLQRVQWLYKSHVTELNKLLAKYLAGDSTVAQFLSNTRVSGVVWMTQLRTILK